MNQKGDKMFLENKGQKLKPFRAGLKNYTLVLTKNEMEYIEGHGKILKAGIVFFFCIVTLLQLGPT